MIPDKQLLGQENFEIAIYPSKTYRMDIERGHIGGMVDGINSMPQAIYKALNTERFNYSGYTMNYGVELFDLYGAPINYALSELKARISEVLTWDSRVISVTDFEFEVNGHQVHCKFIVHTIYRDLVSERTVNI